VENSCEFFFELVPRYRGSLAVEWWSKWWSNSSRDVVSGFVCDESRIQKGGAHDRG
jgi:hypothetical protein